MGYNTDWYGELKTNRAFTEKELKEWNDIVDNAHPSEYMYDDDKREFPSIHCGFEIINKYDFKGKKPVGKHGVFRWMGYEKTYQGKEWTIFFLKKLINWSKTEDIYAEGELEWRGDDGDNDIGRLIVERATCHADATNKIGTEKMLKMHIETVDFKYKREKTAYVFKDTHKIDTYLKGIKNV